jgi:hypothetical protein
MGEQQGNVLIQDGAPRKGGDGIATVDRNKAKCDARDVTLANKTRKFQETTDASLKTILDIIDRKLLPNCPITRADVKMAEDIYGTSVVHLKGKTTRKGGKHVSFNVPTLPHMISDKYKLVTLSGDIFYVNGVRFLSTISRHIQFRTAEHIKDAKLETLEASLKAIQGLYATWGFKINVVHMDCQFEPIRYKLAAMGMHLNTASNEEHVPEIERSNRTVKERVRSVYSTLPFKKLPVRFIVEMVAGYILWLNAFPGTGGVSPTMSPEPS